MKPLLIAAALAATQLVGCANLMSIHRQSNITPSSDGAKASPGAELVLMDAKQRGVFSVKRGDHTVVCAEPSPDALQAVAATTSLSLQDAKNLLQASTGLSESAANIGLRTQSIQLLRDAMYRICEGYAGHAIDDDEVTMLHRRYQSLMLGLLAIEQLTGTVTNAQVALYTQANATAGAAAGQATEALKELKSAREALAAEEASEAKLKTDLDALKSDIQKKKADLKAMDAASEAATALRKQIEDLDKQASDQAAAHSAQSAKVAIQRDFVQKLEQVYSSATSRVSAATSTMAKIAEGQSKQQASTDAKYSAVANSIEQIVKAIVDTSFSNDACLLVMAKAAKLLDRNKPSDDTQPTAEENSMAKTDQAKDKKISRTPSIESRIQLEDATTRLLNRMADVCANRLDTKTQPPQVNPTASTQKTPR